MSESDSTGDGPVIEIKSVSGRVLFVSRASSVCAAVREAVVAGANLYRADLSGAYLYRANLSGANLSGANLSAANLYGAYLSGADLYRANLSGANLSGAYLYRANLSGANLSGADLYGAYLSGADLYGAYLSGATNAEYAIAKTRIIPDEGDITGWKQARDGRIVKLLIPDGTKRSHGAGRKCRAEKAQVIAIYNKNGNPTKTAVSTYDESFKYKVGETVTPSEPFCDDMWLECASGIHFYITRIEAENHA